jgi:hypothetical protein
VLAGVVFAVSSGAGLPAIIDVVFPVLFKERRASEGSSAAVVEWIQNYLGGHSRDRLLLNISMGIPLVFAVRALSGYLITYSGLRAVESIRDEMFVKLQSPPLSFYRKNKAGDLLARLMSDADVLRQAIANSSSDLVKQPLTLIAALAPQVPTPKPDLTKMVRAAEDAMAGIVWKDDSQVCGQITTKDYAAVRTGSFGLGDVLASSCSSRVRNGGNMGMVRKLA